MREPIYIGLDIGGTKTAVLVANQDQTVLARALAPTQTSSSKQLVAGIVAAIEQALDKAGLSRAQIAAIGAGSPGRVVPETGFVHTAVNLNIESYALGPELSAAFAVPVVMENDVRAATLGAYAWLSQLRDVRYMAYISIGTGISAGVMLDKQLYRGATGMAVEIGHVPIESDGPLCACGMHGCLEAYASGPAIARRFREKAPALADQAPTAKEVYELASQGQTDAILVVERTGQMLARAAYMIVNMVDVEVVVFGGGVSSAGAAFLDPIHAAIRAMRRQSPLVRMMLSTDMVLALPPGHSAATWGAVQLARQKAVRSKSKK